MPDNQLVDDGPDGEPDDPTEAAAWDAFSRASQRRRGRREPAETRASRRRTGLFLALLATVALAATAVIVVVLHSGSDTSPTENGAVSQITVAHNALAAQKKDCPSGDGQLDCRRAAAEALSLGYRNFNVDLDRITIPPTASEARDTLEEDADLLSNAYDELSVTATSAAYDRIVSREDVPGLTATFDRHYAALVALVRAG